MQADYADYLDLTRYTETLGDPSKYFVHAYDKAPLVVEHATGRPRYVIDRLGTLRSYEDYRSGQVPAADLPDYQPQPHVYTFGPRSPASPAGIDAQGAPGKIAMGVTVQ